MLSRHHMIEVNKILNIILILFAFLCPFCTNSVSNIFEQLRLLYNCFLFLIIKY